MSLAQASWITVVAICAIATAVTAIAGYAGYAATIAAVGVMDPWWTPVRAAATVTSHSARRGSVGGTGPLVRSDAMKVPTR